MCEPAVTQRYMLMNALVQDKYSFEFRLKINKAKVQMVADRTGRSTS